MYADIDIEEDIALKIIEFNGVPGCGKSTVCRELYEYYRENTSERIIFYQNPLRKSIFLKAVQCFSILCRALLDKKQRRLFFSVLYLGNMVLHQNRFRKYILYQFQYLFKMLIIADYCGKKYRENKTDIILIDQGITQYIVSALYETNYRIASIEYFFKKNNFYTDDCYIIECEAGIQTVLERLKIRKNGKSRVERLDYEQREEKLVQQRAMFDDMRKSYSKYIRNVIRIDTTKISPYRNSQIIIEKAGRSLID